MKSLATFLVICGHGMSNSAIHGNFNHSGETISRKFEEVLNSVVGTCEDYITPIDPNFRTTHPRIANDCRMMPYFKDCIGALDGTHIAATPPPHNHIKYIGRSGKATQNVLIVVDFDLRFTYVSIGQPRSMHDTNVLFHALRHDKDAPVQVCSYILAFANKSVHRNILLITHISLHMILGKYNTVDVGYSNRPGYLAPYKGARYHMPDWKRGSAPSGDHEHFNHLHSSIRNAVERAFGVLKIKWRILLKMMSFHWINKR
jgi:hypothetical protein